MSNSLKYIVKTCWHEINDYCTYSECTTIEFNTEKEAKDYIQKNYRVDQVRVAINPEASMHVIIKDENIRAWDIVNLDGSIVNRYLKIKTRIN